MTDDRGDKDTLRAPVICHAGVSRQSSVMSQNSSVLIQ